MSDFNKIIKQKVEQFEVPYNDAHWAEMEGKLNAAKRLSTLKKALYGVVSLGVILGTLGYFYNNNDTGSNKENNLSIVTDNSTIKENIATNVTNTDQFDNNSIDKNKTSFSKKTIADQINTSGEPIQQTSTSESLQQTNASSNSKEPNINLMVPEEFSTEFIVFNGHVCLGNSVSFEAVEKSDNISFLWNFGDGNTSNLANPTHAYEKNGVFSVSLTIEDNTTGKELTNTLKDVVTIYPKPDVDFDWNEASLSHDDNKMKYPYLEFKVPKNSKNTYNWSFSNGTSSSSQNPKILFDTKGDYYAALTVQNEYGCMNSINKKITVQQSFLLNDYAPTGFIPRSNSSKINTFIPKALLGWDVEFNMVITNRSGDIVYQTTDKYNPWNGRFNNTGAVLDAGTYLWEVTTIDAEGATYNHRGTIKLVD